MKQKLSLLFSVSRPISWINTAFPFASVYLLFGGGLDARLIIGSLFFLIPYNLLMYGVNDVYDYESDIRNPRKGGIEGAITPKNFHPLILGAAAGSCLPFIVYLAFHGTLVSLTTLLVVVFFVVAYSLKGLRFKEIPVLDSITSSLHFVGPALFALSLFGFPITAWPFVAAFFLWGIASHAFGAVSDILPDREASISSIATVLGARGTVRFAYFCYALAVIITALQGSYALPVASAGLLYLATLSPLLRITDETSPRAAKAWRRFIWLNYFAGMVVTLCMIASVYR